jgi:hypothetical protein
LGLAARGAQLKAEAHRKDAEGLMSYMLREFVGSLRPLGRLDLLNSISERAEGYLSSTSAGDAAAQLQRAETLQLIAEVGNTRGHHEKAAATLHTAYAMLTELDRGKSKDRPLLLALAANASQQGEMAMDKKEWDKALYWMEQQLSYAQRATDAMPDDRDLWMQLAYAHNGIGGVLLRQGKSEQAAHHQAASLEQRRRALAQDPENRKLKGDLANNLSWLAETRKTLGQFEAAMALFGEEETLLAAIVKAAPEESMWVARLAYSQYHQGELFLREQKMAEAGQRLNEAFKLMAGISARDPSNQRWQMDTLTFRIRTFDVEAASPAKLMRLEQLLQEMNALKVPATEIEPWLASIRRRIKDTRAAL